jgi:N-acetylmuramoyl-L-alanine amidase
MSARALGIAVALAVSCPAYLAAQRMPRLTIERADGSSREVGVDLGRGYATVGVDLLEDLGWTVTEVDGGVELSAADEISISLRIGTPFFRWDGVVLQLSDPPYREGGRTFVPLQLVTDFLPRRLPGLYDFDGTTSTLRAGDLALLGVDAEGSSEGQAMEEPIDEPALNAPSTYEGVRVVVIDAGHGGVDPGALGPGGVREKTVALGIATRVAQILRRDPNLEVHMTRDDDTFVDLWERGRRATEIKGERPGIFVSIHANSFPARRTASGFETYFLSEARTEHERRVSAIENAPLSLRGEDVDPEDMPDLDFILRELRNFDHAHWSDLLAGLVQDEMNDFHPGPDRGVKQGVLAVLTNALMPAVLVEVGYLSNEEEGRLLGEGSFHRDAADAIAAAVGRFFERYPPGSGIGGSQERR